MRPFSSSLLAAASFVCLGCLAACHSHTISVQAVGHTVTAADGFPIQAYRLTQTPAPSGPPRGLVLYLQGSEDTSVTNSIGSLASFCAMNAPVIALERRGVSPDGKVDADVALKSATLDCRVADAMSVLQWATRDAQPGKPIVLLGASEGADVASAVAARASTITHIILLGGGGGWTQEEEFRHFIRTHRGYMGLKNEAELDAKVADIKAHPNADTMWAGHPYRRWSTFMFHRPADDLLRVNCPILVVQGDQDDAVPIQSARALAKAFHEAGKTNLTLVEIPGADHRFQDVKTGRSLLPRVEVEGVRWLAEQGVLNAAEARAFADRVRSAHPEAF
jgi:pimeloyl-ACP methyl ester carboxylesterase